MQEQDIQQWKDYACAYFSHAQSLGPTYKLLNVSWFANMT
jgi:hypothetical protein